MHHFPLLVAHHVAKHAVAAHVAAHAGSAGIGHAHLSAGHAAIAHASAVTKLPAHGMIATKHMASGAAARHATVASAHGTVTPVSGHVIGAAQPKPVVAIKHVAKNRIIRAKPFKPVLPAVPRVG